MRRVEIIEDASFFTRGAEWDYGREGYVVKIPIDVPDDCEDVDRYLEEQELI